MGRRSSRTPEQVEAFREKLKEGGGIGDAMVAAGLSKRSASKGVAKLPAVLLRVMLDQGKDYIELGKKISAADQENLVRGRLAANAIEGKDNAAMSLKLLGSDRRVNMFTPESQTGVIVIQAPAAFREEIEAKMLEASTVHTVENSE
jgi:hypothetical protein